MNEKIQLTAFVITITTWLIIIAIKEEKVPDWLKVLILGVLGFSTVTAFVTTLINIWT